VFPAGKTADFNSPSRRVVHHQRIALHERLGFRQVGFKFSKWLDLAFYQLILPTHAEPVDG
jgi:L-amino acid N-acyltransferase YncA